MGTELGKVGRILLKTFLFEGVQNKSLATPLPGVAPQSNPDTEQGNQLKSRFLLLAFADRMEDKHASTHHIKKSCIAVRESKQVARSVPRRQIDPVLVD